MATLTAAGINCSNGTLDGQYTGTVANNTAYPIGSYLMTAGGGAIPNGSSSLFKEGNAFYNFNFGSSIALAGAWRQRGQASDLASTLYQRFS